MGKPRRSWVTLTTALVGVAMVTSACGSDSGTSDDGDGGPITLTVATFNEFGYEDLIKEYTTLNPDIKVVQKKAATTGEARDNLNTRLAAGSGLSDIEAVEVDWLPELMQFPDRFVDLTDSAVADRWLPWKAAQATTPDGKLLGYGTDIGPEAICYRGDLLEAAGLPSDREAVAELLGGANATWEKYFEVGRTFKAKSPKAAWFDSAGATFLGQIGQVAEPFEATDGTITVLDNAAIRAMYDSTLKAAVDDGLSAHVGQWSPDWQAAFQNDGFATMICPGWMLGVIEGNSKGVEGWDIADVFPGGGGNWGGSFLTVPTQGSHPEEAKALANWLTAPEQQIKAFQAKGTFPSQAAALTSDVLLGQKDDFFNDAPTGEILANRAKAVTVTPFKGPNYFAISDAMQQALARVDVDKTDDAASSWAKFESAVKALG